MFRLHGLAPAAKYEVTDLDGGAPKRMRGNELMEQGLSVEIKGKPGSGLMVYEKE